MNADLVTGESPPPVIIRVYRPSDDEALVRLWKACGITRPWNDPRRDIARKKSMQPDLFFVAVRDEVLVGSVMGGYDGHRGWAYYLAVLPEYQKQGVARRMMTALETALAKQGCPKLNLMVRSNNTAARGFYQRLGYGRDEVVTLSKRLIPDD
jgi:ribosomal protein S18 acetylase RimI-like enzyme